ncbi:stress-responsive transcriptional regulator [Ligilactobacillus salitolerans]|uniref:Stress-responsive transcriptional regulator n=1 Tax=Ligilactobacillus salitolerans TaxID=1808352 RepID=A0A401IV19_9LACO|nr:PspC domain-containing protein [Ligilactobacillus salitolerans]GBG95393.1 stress-responsive transcriptional regulator [Ligilactobacillus salitolerans]
MKKKLTRSSTDRLLAGVCGGFGEYFNIPAKNIRIGFLVFAVICTILPHFSILPVGLYLICYLAIPQETGNGSWSSMFHDFTDGRQNMRPGSRQQKKDGRKILRDAHERKEN